VRKQRIKKPEFGHGREYELAADLPRMFVSYHPSRQNTNTGKLTPQMMDDVLGRIKKFVEPL
jgi:uracil-DNA glycosylase